MHDVPQLLVSMAIALGTAAVTTLVSRKLKMPVVFGYLLAGFLVGPMFPYLPLSADRETLHVMSELGVILIMFGIGLEFSPQKLMKAGLTALLMASIQACLVMTSGISLGRALGWTTMEAIFMGAAMVATSTVVIVKLFEEGRPSRELREIVFSVTIIHDLIAIILMTVLTTLTKVGVKGIHATDLIWTIVKFILFLAGVIVVGRFFIPQFLRKLADQEKPENLVIASIGFCFSVAILAVASGFSMAIGAFAAGMLAGESGRANMIERLIMPMRDVFTALFFVAVGMMLVPAAIIANFGVILLFVMLVILANAVSLTMGGLFAGQSFRTSFQTGIALGQFGEFAFVMMTIGIAAGMIKPELFTITVSVAVITALTSSFLFKSSGSMAGAIEDRFPDPLKASIGLYQVWIASLRKRGIRKGESGALLKPLLFLLLDWLAIIGLAAVYNFIEKRLPVWITSLNEWRKLTDVALIILLGLGIALLLLSVIKRGRVLARHIAVLTPNPEADGIGRVGRHLFAGGLRILILIVTGIPMIGMLQAFLPTGLLFFVFLAVIALVVTTQIIKARRMSKDTPIGTEWLLARLLEPRQTKDDNDNVVDMDRTGTYRVFRLGAETPGLDNQLSQLDLGGRTGVTIVGLLRDGQNTVPLYPSPTLRLNDRLVLSGSEYSLTEAEAILQGRQ